MPTSLSFNVDTVEVPPTLPLRRAHTIPIEEGLCGNGKSGQSSLERQVSCGQSSQDVYAGLCSPNGLPYEYPVFVRNTFVSVVPPGRNPSLEGFFEERRIHSCPANFGLGKDDEAPAASSRTTACDSASDGDASMSMEAPTTDVGASMTATLTATLTLDNSYTDGPSYMDDHDSDTDDSDTDMSELGAELREARQDLEARLGINARAAALPRDCEQPIAPPSSSSTTFLKTVNDQRRNEDAQQPDASNAVPVPLQPPGHFEPSVHDQRQAVSPGPIQVPASNGERVCYYQGHYAAPVIGFEAGYGVYVNPYDGCYNGGYQPGISSYAQMPLSAVHPSMQPPPPPGAPAPLPATLPPPPPPPRLAEEPLHQPAPTRGSLGHGYGRCKPCAFVHTKGCGNGFECPFCHICEPGEKKKRRKDKLEARRISRELRQAVVVTDNFLRRQHEFEAERQRRLAEAAPFLLSTAPSAESAESAPIDFVQPHVMSTLPK